MSTTGRSTLTRSSDLRADRSLVTSGAVGSIFSEVLEVSFMHYYVAATDGTFTVRVDHANGTSTDVKIGLSTEAAAQALVSYLNGGSAPA
jgi:hypothetical protein